MKMLACCDCSALFWAKRKRSRCMSCKHSMLRRRTLVLKWVSLAVARGELTDLKTNHVPCADCGARARHYDHRDYGKPFDVTPVCVSCNYARGPAVPHRSKAA